MHEACVQVREVAGIKRVSPAVYTTPDAAVVFFGYALLWHESVFARGLEYMSLHRRGYVPPVRLDVRQLAWQENRPSADAMLSVTSLRVAVRRCSLEMHYSQFLVDDDP